MYLFIYLSIYLSILGPPNLFSYVNILFSHFVYVFIHLSTYLSIHPWSTQPLLICQYIHILFIYLFVYLLILYQPKLFKFNNNSETRRLSRIV